MISVNEGDLVYYRLYGKSSWDSSRVVEKAEAQPVPVLYLANGRVMPQTDVLSCLPASGGK